MANGLYIAVKILALIGGIVILLRVFYFFQVATRLEQELRFRATRVVTALVLYLGSFFILQRLGYSAWESLAFSFLLGLTPRIFLKPPKRSRYIPVAVKRAVFARDSEGKAPASRTHHFHHLVPYKHGGDNSVRNLRIATAGYNLRKGAKWPTLWELIGWKRGPLREPTEGARLAAEEALPLSGPRFVPWRLRRLAIWAVVVAMAALCWQAVRSHRPQGSVAAGSYAAQVAGAGSSVESNAPARPEATPSEDQAATAPSPANTTGEPEAPVPTPETSDSSAATPPVSEGTHPATSGAMDSTPPTYTTSDLFRFYAQNKHATDAALRGRVIQLRGTVVKVGKDKLLLREPTDAHDVECKFDQVQAVGDAQPGVGTTVYLRGVVKGRGLLGTIHIEHCDLVTPETQ